MLRALAARYARQAGCPPVPRTPPRLFGTQHRRTGRTQAQEERRRSLDDVLRDTDHVELLSSLPDAPLALQVRLRQDGRSGQSPTGWAIAPEPGQAIAQPVGFRHRCSVSRKCLTHADAAG